MKEISEFIEMLEQIVSDGELTFREIEGVGKWINAHKAMRVEWPVSEFYKLLKGVFADGKIDKNEAVEVARLIQSVRREWSRRNAAKSMPTFYETILTGISEFDPEVPKLPSIPKRLSVPSESDEDVTYSLNFAGPTCDCPDFKSQRAKLPLGHISRCCKHILQGYAQLRPDDGWPSWLDSFVELGIRPKPQVQWAVVPLGKFHALISSPMNEWGNVYLQDDSGNKKFGYNVSEDRWAYGTKPKNASKLVAAFLRMHS